MVQRIILKPQGDSFISGKKQRLQLFEYHNYDSIHSLMDHLKLVIIKLPKVVSLNGPIPKQSIL